MEGLLHIKEPLVLLLARHEFTLLERRIYWAVLKALKNEQTLDREYFSQKPAEKVRELRIHISEIIPADSRLNIDDLRRAAEKIISRRIIFDEEHEGRNDVKFTYIIPFPRVSYHRGWIDIMMMSEVLPYFINLSRGYSQYQLQSAIALTSEYAQLLYPRLCRFLDTGFWKVELDELRSALNAEKYGRYSNFKQRVMDVALKEINERTDIVVEVTENKQGRAVAALTFNIRRRHEREDQFQSFKAEVATGLSLPLEERRRQVSGMFQYYKLTKAQQRQILDDEEKLNAFIRAESYVAQGVKDIENPTAYIAASVFGKGKKSAGER